MTHIYDLFTEEDLAAGLDAKLIVRRESGTGLAIYNYTDAAMWTAGSWGNPAVRQCRGLIVDASTGEVVARPWGKFFNHGQPEAGELDLEAPVEVTDKLDGSLGIIYRDADGALKVATRGSFTSEQAVHATRTLQLRYRDFRGWYRITPLVEIIYPANRVVCDYRDWDDLVLLGAVGVDSGVYHSPYAVRAALGWPGPVAGVMGYQTLRDALAAPPRPGAEGMCVRYLREDRIVKIKQDDYIALHRIVTGLSEKTVWESIAAGQQVTDVLAGLPDELHAWVRDVWDRMTAQADAIHNMATAAHDAILRELPDGWARRDYAERAKALPSVTPYLFQLLDGRDPRPGIHKTLKPAGDTRYRVMSEDVA